MGARRDKAQAREPCAGAGLKKGRPLVHLKDFVVERLGRRAWDGFVATLPHEDGAAVEAVVSAGWCPLSLHARVNRAFCDHFRRGSLSICQELGGFSAERDVSTIHRWFLRLMTPSFILRNMNAYWRRGDLTGEWSSELRENEVLLRLSGWGVVEPALCHRLLGYLGHMLALRGPVEVMSHPRCRDRGESLCEFRFRWRLEADAPLNGSLSSVDDVLSVERELSHCSDVDALEDAIVHLLQWQLQCALVHLWVEPAGGGELMLARSAGKALGGMLQVFPIETRGRVVGRLEVELFAGPEAAHAMDLIDRLSSSFGRLLHAARTSQHDRTIELDQRLARAESRCELTPREVEVLRLVVLGKPYKEIADDLGCEECTVEAHVAHLRRKCSPDGRALSRSELMAWFWTLP